MSTDVNQQTHSSDKVDRRKFIGLATAAAGVMFIKPELVHGTAANSAVRVGLLGCGTRGTEDASNLVDAGARVVALGDLFRDQLDAARAHFDEIQKAKGYAAIDAAQLFVGSNAYKEIVASKELDAIVIATPPYYHPRHLEAAVDAGKHVYLEKPVAVDVPGALKVIEIGKRAEGKLSLDVGFQIRDCPPFVEMVRRIHDGALGKIVCGEAYYLTGYIERPPWPNASALTFARPTSGGPASTSSAPISPSSRSLRATRFAFRAAAMLGRNVVSTTAASRDPPRCCAPMSSSNG